MRSIPRRKVKRYFADNGDEWSEDSESRDVIAGENRPFVLDRPSTLKYITSEVYIGFMRCIVWVPHEA